MSVDMSPAAVSARLRAVAAVSDLRVDRRMDAKLDMRPDAISARIRAVGQLNRLCLKLAERPSPVPA